MIKEKGRSQAAHARRIAWYRGRTQRAHSAADIAAAAFDLFRGHARHLGPEREAELAQAFVTWVEHQVQSTTPKQGRR